MRYRRFFIFAVSGAIALLLAVLPHSVLRPPARNPGSAPLASAPSPSWVDRSAASTMTAVEDPCRHLYNLVCSKKGVTRDPTGSVRPDVDGEKMALKIYEDLIAEHGDWSSDQVNEELVRRIYTPGNVDRLETAYHWVRKEMNHIIDSQPDRVFNPNEKALLKARLKRTELQMPLPVANYGDESYLLTKNDIFYERSQDGKMRLRVGGAYFFTARSWFNQVFTFGHELAHSIDPCEIRSARISIPAYDRLSACFIDRGLVALRQNRSECGENDQLSETFADWFAVQVTAEALRSFSMEFHGQALVAAAVNAVRDLCDQDEADLVPDTELHPSPRTRISRIFGRNPQIRDILGCVNTPPRPAETHTVGSTLVFSPPSRLPAGEISPTPSGEPSNSPQPYCGFDYQPRTM